MMGSGVAGLLFVFPFVLVGFVIWMVLGRRRDKYGKMAEVQKEIISKFSSSAEMQEFLYSDQGRNLFKNLVVSDGPLPRSAREKAIGRLGVGIVLLIVGAGLMVLAHYSDQPQVFSANGIPPSGPILEVPPGSGLPAAALFLTGVGLILSALVTLWLTSGEQSKS